MFIYAFSSFFFFLVNYTYKIISILYTVHLKLLLVYYDVEIVVFKFHFIFSNKNYLNQQKYILK